MQLGHISTGLERDVGLVYSLMLGQGFLAPTNQVQMASDNSSKLQFATSQLKSENVQISQAHDYEATSSVPVARTRG
jgi:hypothetical protein